MDNLKKICLFILILQTYLVNADVNSTAVFNVTKSLVIQVADLRKEVERQGKLLAELTNSGDVDNLESQGRNCAESAADSSGIFEIFIPRYSKQPFNVSCEKNSHASGWTVILRREDGSENFYRNWHDYKHGFGNLEGEFFLGLDRIHALTADRNQQLLVLLEAVDGTKAYEKYDRFVIGDELESYALHTLGNASGDAGDSLRLQLGQKFTTYDRDNDVDNVKNCAKAYTGAWWYSNCHESNLTGKYNDNTFAKGVVWMTFRYFDQSLKRAVMMIRPRA